MRKVAGPHHSAATNAFMIAGRELGTIDPLTRPRSPSWMFSLTHPALLFSLSLFLVFFGSPSFLCFCSSPTPKQTDTDDDKLQKGIDFAKSKGVLDPHYIPEPYVSIDVLGKTPEQVAQLILDDLGEAAAAPRNTNEGVDTNDRTGSVIVLVGLSGTGKGTTVSTLQSILESRNRPVVTWSNGNVFRSLTLLAATWCDQNKTNDDTTATAAFDVTRACTANNLKSFASMLSFERNPNRGSSYDTRICGLGLNVWVHDIQNTDLKAPHVSSNIPAVAELTQGEVLTYAIQAVDTLRIAGYTVLLEGREQTVNYVRSPHRYSLTLSDPSLIGKRRAAQRLMATALARLPVDEDDNTDATNAVHQALEELVQGLPGST